MMAPKDAKIGCKFMRCKLSDFLPIKTLNLQIIACLLCATTLFTAVGINRVTSSPITCCSQTVPANSSPINSSLTSSSAAAITADTTIASASVGGAGCSLTYLDDNFQPLQSLSPQSSSSSQQMSANLMQMTNSSSSSSGSSSTSSQQTTSSLSIGLDCQYVTSEQLHDKFNRIKPAGFKVTSLIVKDSNLTTLSNLPQGFHELKRLTISNTSIDLEVLKEGSESLDQLTILEITNEKISNIPQNFFQEMQSLRELRLENDEIASLDGDAFHNLDDSLEVLVLRNNRFNRFPMAVKNLAQLAVLDLSDNDIVIDTQENDLPEKLEPLLNLRELVMNRINCTCEFSSSPFFEWIARTHISGVRCYAPDKFVSKEVIVFERDEFCARHSGGSPFVNMLKLNNMTSSMLLLSSLTSIHQLVTRFMSPPHHHYFIKP